MWRKSTGLEAGTHLCSVLGKTSELYVGAERREEIREEGRARTTIKTKKNHGKSLSRKEM